MDETLEDLVTTATKRAYEQAMVLHGRVPTQSEVTVVLVQAQIAVLAASLFDPEELLTYWGNIITVIRGGKSLEAS